MSMRIKLPATQLASRHTVGVSMLPSRVSPLSSRRPLARKVLAVQTEEKQEQTESKPEIAKVCFIARFDFRPVTLKHDAAAGCSVLSNSCTGGQRRFTDLTFQ